MGRIQIARNNGTTFIGTPKNPVPNKGKTKVRSIRSAKEAEKFFGKGDLATKKIREQSIYLKRMKIKILPGDNINCGDYLYWKRGPKGALLIQKATDLTNGYAAEDLTNLDGSAYINISSGSVYNNP